MRKEKPHQASEHALRMTVRQKHLLSPRTGLDVTEVLEDPSLQETVGNISTDLYALDCGSFASTRSLHHRHFGAGRLRYWHRFPGYTKYLLRTTISKHSQDEMHLNLLPQPACCSARRVRNKWGPSCVNDRRSWIVPQLLNGAASDSGARIGEFTPQQ